MSMQERIYETAVAASATGTAQESNTTPFVEESNAKLVIEMTDDFAGTPKWEGSDDGTTYVDVWAPGAVVAATSGTSLSKVVQLKKFMRFTTTRTAGSVVKASAYSGV